MIGKANWQSFLLHDYSGAAEPPVRCGVSHLSGLSEPPRNNQPSGQKRFCEKPIS